MNMEEFQSKLKDKIEKLKKQLTEIEEELKKSECKAFKPKYGEEYYYIDSEGEIDRYTYCKSPIVDMRYSIGNCFETQKEAEFEVERLKVIAELKRFAEEHNELLNWDDIEQSKWCILYSFANKKIHISYILSSKDSDIYFSSQQIAINAISQIGEDRIKKYYLRVEETKR